MGTIDTINKHFGLPTATVLHSRLPIFQATRRAKGITQSLCDTPWGSAEVTGKLGQEHRDLHDVIMTYGEEYRFGELGDLHIVIDPSKIYKELSIKTDPRVLDRLLEDMRIAKVFVKYAGGGSSLGGIVSVVDKKFQEIPGPGGVVKKRMLWCVTISRTWVAVYNSCVRIRYEPALSTILGMRSGYSQAISRFFLTHTGRSTFEFKEIVKILGIDREAKKVKMDIRSDLEALGILGITLSGDVLNYEQRPGMVSFQKPKKRVLEIGSSSCSPEAVR